MSLNKITFIIILLLPLIYGCNGGGSAGSASSSDLNVSGDAIDVDPGLTLSYLTATEGDLGGGAVSTDAPGDSLAKIHNPEPATIILLGAGVMAMGCMRRRRTMAP